MSKQLVNLLLTKIDSDLGQAGFKLSLRNAWFTRRGSDRFDRFRIIPIYEPGLGYRLRVHVNVRFHVVEEIFHRTSGFSQKAQVDTCSIGFAIEHPGADGGHYIFLHGDRDLCSTHGRIVELFHRDAAPYFSRVASIRALDRELNADPERSRDWLECSKGLIAAKLVGRRDYDQIEAIYRGRMERLSKGFYLKWFAPLVEDLSSVQAIHDEAPAS